MIRPLLLFSLVFWVGDNYAEDRMIEASPCIQKYAEWLSANEDKKGTRDFEIDAAP